MSETWRTLADLIKVGQVGGGEIRSRKSHVSRAATRVRVHAALNAPLCLLAFLRCDSGFSLHSEPTSRRAPRT